MFPKQNKVFDRDGNGKIDVVELCYMFQIEYRRKDGGKNLGFLEWRISTILHPHANSFVLGPEVINNSKVPASGLLT